jgi:RND family efflux transporter MFP subunit
MHLGMKNFLLALATIGIVVCFVLIKMIARVDTPPPPPENPAVNPYKKAIAASGIVEALEENVAIGVPQSALVTEIYVDVGSKVKLGDPLFKLDTRDLEAHLAVQKADVQVQKAALDRLKDQLSRLESIKDRRAVSIDEVKTRENDVTVADTQMKKSEEQVKKTETLIDRLTIRAPRDGIILQNNLRVGEFVTQDPTKPGMILGNVDRLQVRLDIDEQNASRFDPKMEAYAYPKNNTDLRIPLQFAYIEPYVIPKKSLTGSSDERVDTRVLQVIYRFEQPKDFNLYVGQQVDAFIEAH